MLKNYLKIAFRNILKYKVHSVINILGFSITLAVVFLLSLYINTEISADKLHKNYRSIYRLQKSESEGLAPQFADIILENFTEVEKVTRIISAPRIILNYNKPLYINNIISVDNTFFDIFAFKAITGDIKTASAVPPVRKKFSLTWIIHKLVISPPTEPIHSKMGWKIKSYIISLKKLKYIELIVRT